MDFLEFLLTILTFVAISHILPQSNFENGEVGDKQDVNAKKKTEEELQANTDPVGLFKVV